LEALAKEADELKIPLSKKIQGFFGIVSVPIFPKSVSRLSDLVSMGEQKTSEGHCVLRVLSLQIYRFSSLCVSSMTPMIRCIPIAQRSRFKRHGPTE
jgi:hypothetical protein